MRGISLSVSVLEIINVYLVFKGKNYFFDILISFNDVF